ncbi:hypothetical protein [Sphingomonas daechungensis]|uniref:hypothetical protein n=1 Tax=Sphingomonas daechungensis TaxID=1176646 RepID=UPI001CB96289|nr:hypothetical protein [Sphingomonas daechungensis]
MIRADRYGRLLLAGVAGLAIATPTWAQTAEQTTAEAQQQAPGPEATTATNDEGQDSATGEIVVTARRTDERLQRVPPLFRPSTNARSIASRRPTRLACKARFRT